MSGDSIANMKTDRRKFLKILPPGLPPPPWRRASAGRGGAGRAFRIDEPFHGAVLNRGDGKGGRRRPEDRRSAAKRPSATR